MAEVLVEYPDVLTGDDGKQYVARACGREVSRNAWHAWIEFESLDGGSVVRSPRETTQPNRTDTVYWATGITPVYLEGALRRALNPAETRTAPPAREPIFDTPAPNAAPAGAAPEPLLDPFAVYAKSEQLLRRQLTALSSWHLVNIVTAYAIPTPGDPNRIAPSALIESIVNAAREQAGTAHAD